MARRLRPHELYDLLGLEPLDEGPGLGSAGNNGDADPAGATSEGFGSSSESSLAPMVLIADPRPERTEALCSSLSRDGYQVLLARSGPEILDALVRQRVRTGVAIIRHSLLTSGGADLVRRLRSIAPAMPIIIQSNDLTPSERHEMIRNLDVDAIDNDRDDPERALDLVRCALATAHCFERIRADQEVRGLILAKLCDSLSTPLHVIQGYTEILREEPTTASAEEILHRLADATDTAIGILHDYLDLAQLDAPGILVRRERVGIDEVLAEIRDVARHEIGIRPLKFVVDALLTGSFIYTDGEKLRAILAQLVANAVKFTPIGVVRLSVRPRIDRTDFVLTDGGAGIDEDAMKALFTPFRQGAGDQVSSIPGHGIGLAIAERLSNLIGASLTAANGDAGGATFVLSIPGAMTLQTANALRHTVH